MARKTEGKINLEVSFEGENTGENISSIDLESIKIKVTSFEFSTVLGFWDRARNWFSSVFDGDPDDYLDLEIESSPGTTVDPGTVWVGMDHQGIDNYDIGPRVVGEDKTGGEGRVELSGKPPEDMLDDAIEEEKRKIDRARDLMEEKGIDLSSDYASYDPEAEEGISIEAFREARELLKEIDRRYYDGLREEVGDLVSYLEEIARADLPEIGEPEKLERASRLLRAFSASAFINVRAGGEGEEDDDRQ